MRLPTKEDIGFFLQGYCRLILYKTIPFLLRKKVKDHYRARLRLAKPCLDNTECLACGCSTPALFFANKACSAPEYLERPACYPSMSEDVPTE